MPDDLETARESRLILCQICGSFSYGLQLKGLPFTHGKTHCVGCEEVFVLVARPAGALPADGFYCPNHTDCRNKRCAACRRFRDQGHTPDCMGVQLATSHARLEVVVAEIRRVDELGTAEIRLRTERAEKAEAERDAAQAEAAAIRKAIGSAMAAMEELNPQNYDDEDVRRVSSGANEAHQILRDVISAPVSGFRKALLDRLAAQSDLLRRAEEFVRLAEARESNRLKERYSHSGFMNATQLSEKENIEAFLKRAAALVKEIEEAAR